MARRPVAHDPEDDPMPASAQPARRRITPALAVATAALVVSVAGSGYAAIAIPQHSVGTRQLKEHAVGPKQLQQRAVTAGKIVPGAGVSVLYTRASNTVSVAAGGVGGG